MFSNYNDVVEVEDLMDILNIGRNRAYALIKSGELQSFRIGKMYKIPKVCIKNYILSSVRKLHK